MSVGLAQLAWVLTLSVKTPLGTPHAAPMRTPHTRIGAPTLTHRADLAHLT